MVDLSTDTVKKVIMQTIAEVKNGSLSTKTANCIFNGCRGLLYANQIQATEDRIKVDQLLAEKMEALSGYIEGGDQEIPELIRDDLFKIDE